VAKNGNVMFDKKVLFHSSLKLFLNNLCFRSIGSFIVTNIFNHGAIEIQSLEKVIKVKGQHLKSFYEGFMVGIVVEVNLAKP
jgi:formate/nitrite transporter FocA (FNT family)